MLKFELTHLANFWDILPHFWYIIILRYISLPLNYVTLLNSLPKLALILLLHIILPCPLLQETSQFSVPFRNHIRQLRVHTHSRNERTLKCHRFRAEPFSRVSQSKRPKLRCVP